MRRLLFMAALILCGQAHAADMVTVDLAENHVDITTGFNGAQVELFGVKRGAGPVAVVLRGPSHDMTVRRKDKTGGAWLNRTWVNFDDVPVYYDYALSMPEEELASPEVLQKAGIGLGSLEFKTGETELKAEFREALIRNQQAAGVFRKEPRSITDLGNNFFRVNFYLPSNVHVGTYRVHTYYFRNGKVQDMKTSTLRVAHVGMSARILQFAQDHAVSYGVLCVFLAVFAGWLSNRIRRSR